MNVQVVPRILLVKYIYNMYYNKVNVKAFKSDTKTYYSEGYVDIKTKEAILN